MSQDENHKTNGAGRPPQNGYSDPKAGDDADVGKPDEDEADAEETEGGEAGEVPLDEIEAMPGNVAELCAACVRFVTAKYGVMLDFTPETLSLVDQYVRDVRAEIAAKPESVELLQAAIGAYLGEVIRRAHRGLWQADGEYDTWRVLMTRVYLAFNPIGMAREALQLEEAPGWHAHLGTDPAERDALDQRLAALPEVEDDEFYAPTTRFDIVEIAIEALAAQMRDSGLGDVRFTRDDYRAG